MGVIVGIADVEIVPDTGEEVLLHLFLGHGPSGNAGVVSRDKDSVLRKFLVLIGVKIKKDKRLIVLFITLVVPAILDVFDCHKLADIGVGGLSVTAFRKL